MRALRARAVVIGLLLAIGSAKSSHADFIPLTDGFYEYLEIVDWYTRSPGNEVVGHEYGDDDQAPEYVEVIAGGAATGWAETIAGGIGLGPTAAGSGRIAFTGESSDAGSAGKAGVQYDIKLIKLHPDAPDDVFVPLTYTASISRLGGVILIENLATGEQVAREQNDEGTLNQIESNLTIPVNSPFRIETQARSAPSLTNEPPTVVTAPVFQMDPNFLVPFIDNADGSQRFERAVDLYTLAYPGPIGYAGSFKTATPLTDGCLPDPSILGPDGAQSVTGGATVTCRALDPSGFRSYGLGVQDPMGDLDLMSIVITPGAIVRTDDNDTQTIGILGNDNEVFNEGTILATGYLSDAISFAGGNGNSVENHGAIDSTGLESNAIDIVGDGVEVYSTGAISSSGDESTAVVLEGTDASVLNEGVITTDGLESSAVVIEGDDGLNINEGEIQTSSHAAAGLVIEGDNGTLDNGGTIATQGVFSAGMVMLGFYSDSLENTGTITTIGADAMGILALGPGHTVENIDTEATTGTRNRIWTTGVRAHGIALGLQDGAAVIPPGVEIPPVALQPVPDGVIDNTGLITTQGNEADAIHALAEALPVTNSGELSTLGLEAHAISISGNEANVDNTGILSTAGIGSHGVYILGDDAVINHGDDTTLSTIETIQRDAKGIVVLGDRAKITIDGESVTAGIGTLGEFADAVLVSGDNAEITSTGELIVLGDRADGIDAFGDDGRFENLGSITAGQGAASNSNSGINVSGDRNRVYNNKSIFVESNNSFGVFVQGDDAVVANGDIQHPSALIGVVGNNAVALRVESDAPTVTNDGELAAEGDNVFGISAVTGAGSTFQVTSDNQISVAGSNVVGMSIATSNLWSAGTAGGLAPTCPVTSDGKSKIVNCGNIEILNSTGGTGMLAVDVVDTTIENQEHIVGSGASLRGIEVIADPFSGSADNYIGNVDLIELSGDDSIGIAVSGNANLILHGTATIAVPIVPLADPLQYIDPFGEALFRPDTIVTIVSDFDQATSTSPNPIIPRGNVSVTGANAIGITVDGDDNRIAITVNEDPNAGPGQIGLSTTVTATGANSIGVKLTGNNNLLVNGGEVVASGVGVLGGNGSESVDNKNLISGGVQLNGGDDVLIIEDGSEIIGVADGGLDNDVLIISTPKFLGFPATPAFEIDGSKFVNFEQLEKVGAGNARLTGTLVVDDARILQGDLQLANAYLQTAGTTVTIAPDGSLSGTGTLEGRVEVNGGTLAPGIGVGEMNIDGDLILAGGVLEFEMSQSNVDSLIVTGDVFLDDGNIEVILDYIPDAQDVLPLMLFGNTLQLAAGFDGIIGTAASSGVPIGTQFMVGLGDEVFQATVTSMVPVPPAVYFFGSALAALFAIGRRRQR